MNAYRLDFESGQAIGPPLDSHEAHESDPYAPPWRTWANLGRFDVNGRLVVANRLQLTRYHDRTPDSLYDYHDDAIWTHDGTRIVTQEDLTTWQNDQTQARNAYQTQRLQESLFGRLKGFS